MHIDTYPRSEHSGRVGSIWDFIIDVVSSWEMDGTVQSGAVCSAKVPSPKKNILLALPSCWDAGVSWLDTS